ncbi:hypothetical protein KW801_04070 [Candidatus Saccharibacteria bacterium]|nr:hypothetical protein [Candidatus Saccharibacteria bacterium]
MTKKRYAVLTAIGAVSLGALAAAGASLSPKRFGRRNRLQKARDVFQTAFGR